MLNYKKFEDYDNYIVFKTGKVFSLRTNIFLKPSLTRKGYLTLRFYNGCRKSRRDITIHRLLGILFITNPENKPQIDHINRKRTDNRIENLRWADAQEQGMNQKIAKNNKTGCKGLFLREGRKKKWNAYLMVNRKMYQKGFESKEEALVYRRELEIKYLGDDYIV